MSHSPLSETAGAEKPAVVDFEKIGRDLKLSPSIVENAARLLDEGNTIPFITRFRKDLTGAANEKQLAEIKRAIVLYRALAERKAFILKSIESQGALTDELKEQISHAANLRALEDLYLPFKPQKQSRALVAKQQGLEALMEEILSASTNDLDLASRATHFVRVDKGLNSVDDVIRGVTDLLVERFSANGELKHQLRQIVKKTGVLVSTGTEEPQPESVLSSAEQKPEIPVAVVETAGAGPVATVGTDAVAAAAEDAAASETVTPNDESSASPASAETGTTTDSTVEMDAIGSSVLNSSIPVEPAVDGQPQEPLTTAGEPVPKADLTTESKSETEPHAEAKPCAESDSAQEIQSPSELATDPASASGAGSQSAPAASAEAATPAPAPASAARKSRKKKKKKTAPNPFKDYVDFKQPLNKLSHHQFLAISRGERAEKLKLRLQADEQQITQALVEAVVPAEHPFAEFLLKSAHDALTKVLLPSIEREIRRELTESAERHATEVFANNLRNLLLQPPLRNGRVLAIDPGFKSGCGMVVLDELGNVLEHGQIYVVGNQTKRDESKTKIADWAQRHQVRVIAIGSGAACRQAEQMVSELIGQSLAELNIRYVMVNEAGASVYSTSEIGREELPDFSPAIRSAVSIGRRLQDPVSEFVKISPPNIGVGMYQHDVKAKHLVESLDEIVEACVNQVGVNANTSSVSLLKYVSGLNALAARRLVEQRQKIGGFKNRLQLKEVSGIGEATFVQAAGFLRIHNGENPLDATAIHPESYPLAHSIIELAQTSLDELFPQTKRTPAALMPQIETTIAAVQDTVADPAQTVSNDPQSLAGSDAETHLNIEPSQAQPIGASLETSGENLAEGAEIPAEISAESSPAAPTPSPTEGRSAAAEASKDTPASDSAAEASAMDSAADSEYQTKLEARSAAIQRLSQLDLDAVANQLGAGKMLVRDIILALKKPAWDPRDRIAKPIFRSGIVKLDDLKPEMQLEGQVVNVVDFGVFVDIGLGESSLVHVSQLSNRYIADPHRLYSVGDILKVWVAEIDSARRRVKLTAVQPGSKNQEPKSRSRSRKPESSPSRSPSRSPSEETTSADSTPRHQDKFAGKSKAGRFGSKPQPQRRDGQEKSYGSRQPNSRFDRQGKQGQSPPHARKPKRTEPAPPITDGMLKGNEPMRSFSDLLQFVQQKPKKEDKS